MVFGVTPARRKESWTSGRPSRSGALSQNAFVARLVHQPIAVNSCHLPGMPFSSCSPRSEKLNTRPRDKIGDRA